MFLLKDPNGNPDEDMRTWIGRQHPTTITNRFYKNISLWLLGLNSFDEKYEFLSFNDASNPIVFSKAYDDLPISIVNIKKESGRGSVGNNELWDYMGEEKKFGLLLRRQIEILNPNIVVCGGGSGTVRRIAQQVVFPDLEFEKVNNWIYYNEKRSLV